MGSTGTERSLSSGLIPQWMKSKIDTRLAQEDTIAFSPPTSDDGFFYIRFPRENINKDMKDRDVGFRPISQILQDQPISNQEANGKSTSTAKIDYSKHTAPCQQFIPQAGLRQDIPPAKPKISGTVRVKSAGTDDGFKGEGAACGTSIIHVANQMVSGKSVTRGFHINTSSLDTDCQPSDGPPSGFDPVARRGSRSLPTSPLTSPSVSPNSSPKSRRKLHNRYFTGAFIDKTAENRDKYQGSWILSGLLGQRELLSRSTTTIVEEDATLRDVITRTQFQGVEVNNVTMDEPVTPAVTPVADKTEKPKGQQLFRPKPSELREMNFWSPTSM